MSWRRKSSMGALFLGLVVALTAAAATACGGDPAPPGARLAIDGDSFDLGSIRTGQSVRRSIEFRNTGVAPLEVSIVKVRRRLTPNAAAAWNRSRLRPRLCRRETAAKWSSS